MFIVNYYIINLQMVLMMGEYNRYGRLCTRVVEVDRTFLVEKTPIEIVKDTIQYIGFDLKGAITGAKRILGKINMCPIIVNPVHGICLFPNKAYKHEETIWFNPIHIIKTSALGRHTKVDLSNGYSIEIHSRLSAFNTKLQMAEQLRKITVERGNSSLTLILDPKKGKLIKRNQTGSYNFDVLEKEKK